MSKAKVYTSKQILKKDDLYDLQDNFSSSGISFKYKLTKEEMGWLKFVEGDYCIADWINNNRKGRVLTFNCSFEMSENLKSDGCQHKAPFLSDDTALQKLFFWLSIDLDEYGEE